MSLQDPIADMLTQIRNGQMSKKEVVEVPASQKKLALLKVFEDEGYILGFKLIEDKKPSIKIRLKYYNNKPVIEKIQRVSRPGLRSYKGKDDLPKVMGGLGITVISTPQGVMSDKKARELGQGGEVICLLA
jgi:small subunit ribosomal protein S8